MWPAALAQGCRSPYLFHTHTRNKTKLLKNPKSRSGEKPWLITRHFRRSVLSFTECILWNERIYEFSLSEKEGKKLACFLSCFWILVIRKIVLIFSCKIIGFDKYSILIFSSSKVKCFLLLFVKCIAQEIYVK